MSELTPEKLSKWLEDVFTPPESGIRHLQLFSHIENRVKEYRCEGGEWKILGDDGRYYWSRDVFGEMGR